MTSPHMVAVDRWSSGRAIITLSCRASLWPETTYFYLCVCVCLYVCVHMCGSDSGGKKGSSELCGVVMENGGSSECVKS